MEHEVVGQLQNSANSEYLHVYVRLSDVASVTLDTEPSRPLTFDLSDATSTLSPRSALTHSLITAKPVQPSPESRLAIQLRVSCYISWHCEWQILFFDLFIKTTFLLYAQCVVHRLLCKALFQLNLRNL